jgi:hypothetical protein
LQWTGFIDPDSCAEELLDAPKVLQLKATDGIGLLKNMKYRKVDTTDAYEFISCLNVITNCIYQTGLLDIDLAVEVSLFNDGQQDRDTGVTNEPLVQTYIHTRSFMTSATEYDNCYNVLSAVLNGFHATLFQAGGRWNIVRFPDKWQSVYRYATIYPPPWNIALSAPEWQHLLNVNLEDVVPINADHQRRFIASAEKAIVTYDYKIPDDLPRNKTWSRGDDTSAPAWRTPYDAGMTVNYYTIDNWDVTSGSLGTPVDNPADTYFLRNDQYDSTTNLIIESQSELAESGRAPGTVVNIHRARSEQFRVAQQDYLSFSFDTLVNTNTGGQYDAIVAVVILYGDDNNNYLLAAIPHLDNSYGWHAVDLNDFTLDNQLIFACLLRVPAGDVISTYHTFKIDNVIIPVNGSIEIHLLNWAPFFAYIPRWTRFKSFSLTISPFLNGKRGVRGEEATVYQVQTRRQNAELAVKIGSSPRPYFNGTLFLADGETICNKWYTPNDAMQKRLSEIVALDLYRARYRLKTKVDGSLKGIMYEDPVSTNYKTFLSPYTYVKYGPMDEYIYLPTNLEINFEDNTARVYLYEFYHSIDDNPIEPGDSQTFKYLYE